MSQFALNWIFIGASFALYFGIAIWARAGSTSEFYAAGRGVNPVVNGMATAADWMSAASFISMAGLIAKLGYGGGVFLMGWTGGYVLLAMLLAPYLRKFGKFTVPEFIGDRFYSPTARTVAVFCLVVVSVTYVLGQMTGVGVVFSRYLGVSNTVGLWVGAGVVLVYAVLGGMKGITYTQVAQYCVLITAYTIPAIFISLQLTGNFLPQLGFIGNVASGNSLLSELDALSTQLGFKSYTNPGDSLFTMSLYTLTLMIGTAGLPHVIIRFFTVPKVSDARWSAGWALVFIAILYTQASAVAAMAKYNLIETVYPEGNVEAPIAYDDRPQWMQNWEVTGLLGSTSSFPKTSDNSEKAQGARDAMIAALASNPGNTAYFNTDEGTATVSAEGKSTDELYAEVAALIDANAKLTFLDKNGDGSIEYRGDDTNELSVNGDILVLANPEIAGLPGWVIAIVAAGGIAAALSTAAGLLLAISSAISHDLIKSQFNPNISERGELTAARISMVVTIILATWIASLGLPLAAQTVALAFGLAASSIFPVLMMGIFSKRINKQGAIAGMLAGITVTLLYVFLHNGWFFIASTKVITEGSLIPKVPATAFGAIGAAINFAVAFLVSRATAEPPQEIQDLVESVRIPQGAGAAVDH